MKPWKILSLAGSMLAAAALAAVAAPAPGAGLGLDSSQPIAVNADSFLADLNNEVGTYTGNVIVTQGQTCTFGTGGLYVQGAGATGVGPNDRDNLANFAQSTLGTGQ